MPQYLISVLHAPGAQANDTVYADEAETNAAFERVGEFNASLGERLLFAGGLTPPEEAVVIDASGVHEGPAVSDAPWLLGGLWVIEADDDQQARDLTVQGQAACGQTLELRRLHG